MKEFLPHLNNAIGGIVGVVLGWMFKALSNVNKRETEVWTEMNRRLTSVEGSLKECREEHKECQREIIALNQTVQLVTQENGVLKESIAKLEGLEEVRKTIERFR
jgi:septal ring factor EnvC (AmiA/AmiB activator)